MQVTVPEHKKQFQLERMILFSDAVFAIAITLLVIEIKVPEIEHATDAKLASGLLHMIPKFIGFLLSFLVIGLNWTIHHRMFGYVIDYNQRLLWINLYFLLAIVLMPFSTAFWSEYVNTFHLAPVIVYVSNICFLGLMNFWLWRYIGNPKRMLTEGLTKPLADYYSWRALLTPFVFIVMALVYVFVHPLIAVWIPMLIPLLIRIFPKKSTGIIANTKS